jgi:hypothetical protein
MRIRFTEHAVDRFMLRYMPHTSRREACEELNRLAQVASPLKEKTRNGDSMAMAEHVVFVLKYDRSGGADCVTVLFDKRAKQTNPLAREIAQFGSLPNEPVPAPAPRRQRSRRASRW